MKDILVGNFKISIWDDCSESDALYGYDGVSYRQGIRIDFKDPEDLWLPVEDDGWTTIKCKTHDGSMEQAIYWAKDYLKTINLDNELIDKIIIENTNV